MISFVERVEIREEKEGGVRVERRLRWYERHARRIFTVQAIALIAIPAAFYLEAQIDIQTSLGQELTPKRLNRLSNAVDRYFDGNRKNVVQEGGITAISFYVVEIDYQHNASEVLFYKYILGQQLGYLDRRGRQNLPDSKEISASLLRNDCYLLSDPTSEVNPIGFHLLHPLVKRNGIAEGVVGFFFSIDLSRQVHLSINNYFQACGYLRELAEGLE